MQIIIRMASQEDYAEIRGLFAEPDSLHVQLYRRYSVRLKTLFDGRSSLENVLRTKIVPSL